MGLMDLAKRTFVFQDITSFIKAKIPIVLEHNLGKYDTIKKAMYLTALEDLHGDYYEFGVFTGSSFIMAIRSHNQFKKIGSNNTTFFGFDSFTGFGDVSKEDEHPFYLNDTFTSNKDKVIRYIKRRAGKNHVRIIPGFFAETLKTHSDNWTMNPARVILIDCDLMEPAKLAFRFIADKLQIGTIIILDDFYSYKGSSRLGVAGAFFDFCEKNQNIKFRELLKYGAGGIAFIVENV